jgi:hypothetical protein
MLHFIEDRLFVFRFYTQWTKINSTPMKLFAGLDVGPFSAGSM